MGGSNCTDFRIDHLGTYLQEDLRPASERRVWDQGGLYKQGLLGFQFSHDRISPASIPFKGLPRFRLGKSSGAVLTGSIGMLSRGACRHGGRRSSMGERGNRQFRQLPLQHGGYAAVFTILMPALRYNGCVTTAQERIEMDIEGCQAAEGSCGG